MTRVEAQGHVPEAPLLFRSPVPEDLPGLLRLEEKCWPLPLAADEILLSDRIERYPEGNLVAVMGGRIAGAIYAQRIGAVEELTGVTWKTVSSLHRPEGPVVQLLSINADPENSGLGLGDRLLRHALTRAFGDERTRCVAAVSLCGEYGPERGVPLSRYIAMRDRTGNLLDPILRFHQLNGAEIRGLVEGYRPEDIRNQGCGVLVVYGGRRSAAVFAKGEAERKESVAETVAEAVLHVLGEGGRHRFRPDVPLSEMGLDSLGLFALRSLLGNRLGVCLSPTFFFEYGTVERIAARLEAGDLPPEEAEKDGLLSEAASGVCFARRTSDPGEPAIAMSPEARALIIPGESSGAVLLENERDRPAGRKIAIIGMACRFPGAEDLAGYWRLLRRGEAGVGTVPGERWDMDRYYDPEPGKAGRIVSRFGGFLASVDRFDADFFHISRREAEKMDPQHRILLEVTRNGLEHAGLNPEALAGSRTGVFSGIFASDYEALMFRHGRGEDMDAHFGTGVAQSMAAGRVAYHFGFEGPAFTVNTACSSSLVAVHQAVLSLLAGECDLALASGVNLILTPEQSISFSVAGMLAPDGRCKAFDASADGYVRSEGCGVVVLRRLSEALSRGDRILGVILGSAVNHDGRSNGLTAPSQKAQEAVLRQALRAAGVTPADIGYLEAHGTGTSLGDPVELETVSRVYGAGRTRVNPLVIGSVKTNIGHTEGAAGMAGLIKTVLALRHRFIPAHLHFRKPNPLIDLGSIPAVIPVSGRPWKGDDPASPRRAAVSAFGFSGTNVHLIVEEAPRVSSTDAGSGVPRSSGSCLLFTLSARNPELLRTLAQAHAAHMAAHGKGRFANICYTSNVSRSHLPHRLCIPAESREELFEKLSAFASGASPPGIFRGSAAKKLSVAFLFTGQGAQYPGMGRALYRSDALFRNELDRCERLLMEEAGFSLRQILFEAGKEDSALHRTEFTQPAMFCLEYALARVWIHRGIRPEMMMGHSVGEYVAACLAGVFSLEDGIRLIAARARLMQALPEGGAMAMVLAGGELVERLLSHHREKVSVAAFNGPANTTLSGEREHVAAVLRALGESGVDAVPLPVSHAFHSPLMAPVLDPFRQVLETVSFHLPEIPLVCNLTGEVADRRIATPDYWLRHLREPVQFHRGIRTLDAAGQRIFLEIGPKPVLTRIAERCLEPVPSRWGARLYLPSMVPGKSEDRCMAESLARFHAEGAEVAWDALAGSPLPEKAPLPPYPFGGGRYWIDTSAGQAPFEAGVRRDHAEQKRHPLLGTPIPLATGQRVHQSRIGGKNPPYLKDHTVLGRAVMPAAGFLEMAMAAGDKDSDFCGVGNFRIEEALFLDGEEEQPLQTILGQADTGGCPFEIHRRDAGGKAAWRKHAGGRLLRSLRGKPALLDLGAVKGRLRSLPDWYGALPGPGIHFGPSFRSVEALWVGSGEALGRIRLPLADPGEGYRLHPVLLDGAFQVALAAVSHGTKTLRLLTEIERFETFGPLGATVWGHAVMRSGEDAPANGTVADLVLYDEQGSCLAVATGMRFRAVAGDARHGQDAAVLEMEGLVYGIGWEAILPGVAAEPDAAGASLESMRERLPAPDERQESPAMDHRLTEDLEALSLQYILQGFRNLGWNPAPGERITFSRVRELLNILPRHERLLERFLSILTEEGLLARDQAGWIVRAALPPSDPEGRSAHLCRRYPGARTELSILHRCGSRLADVLSGQCPPLELIFPSGDAESAFTLYSEAPAFAAMNRLLCRKVETLAEALVAGGRPIRILEIGAGTGGTTCHLLPRLSPERTDYLFTDLSSMFTRRASARFSAFPFVRYAVFDIAADPHSQGVAPGSWDMVIAANVLHATADLGRTLEHVRSMLCPEGVLVLLEGTEKRRWIDLIFGLLDGWWGFSDCSLRPDYPLLERDRWCTLLEEHGFGPVIPIAAGSPEETPFPQTLFMAGASGEKNPHLKKGPIAADNPSESLGWLIFADRGGLGERVAGRLSEAGDTCTLVFQGEGFRQTGPGRCLLDPGDPQAYRHLLDAVPAPGRVLHLWSLDRQSEQKDANRGPEAEVLSGCRSLLFLVQALLEAGATPRLRLVTRGAQPLPGTGGRGKCGDLRPGAATLPGMAAVLMREHPEFFCQCLDLDPGMGTGEETLLTAPWEAFSGEPVVAVRGGILHVPRLWRRRLPVSGAPLPLRRDGGYLVTGGMGGAGLETASWMAENGAGHLFLLGRNAPSAAAAARIAEMEAMGTKVTPLCADVADDGALDQALAKAEKEKITIRGVVHAAGMFEDSLLSRHSWERFERVLSAKVTGGWNLYRRFRGKDLDFMLLFSSATVLIPTPGLSNYTAANAFLDLLAHRLRAEGIPATSIAWGPWEKTGMARAVGDLRAAQWDAFGLRATPPGRMLASLAPLLGGDAAHAAIMDVDWSRCLPHQPAALLRGFYRRLSENGEAPAREVGYFAARLKGMAPSERLESLRRHVTETVLGVTGGDPLRLDPEVGLFQQGLDSLTSMELRRSLQESLGCTLETTVIFRYPNVNALAAHLFDQVPGYGVHVPGGPSSEDPIPEEIREGAEACSGEGLASAIEAELAGLESLLGRS